MIRFRRKEKDGGLRIKINILKYPWYYVISEMGAIEIKQIDKQTDNQIDKQIVDK